MIRTLLDFFHHCIVVKNLIFMKEKNKNFEKEMTNVESESMQFSQIMKTYTRAYIVFPFLP